MGSRAGRRKRASLASWLFGALEPGILGRGPHRVLVPAAEPAERTRHDLRGGDVAFDPAAPCESAVGPRVRRGEGAGLVRPRQAHPQIVGARPDRITAEELLADEVA